MELSKNRISRLLGSMGIFDCEIDAYDVIGSTNTELKGLAETGAKEGRVMIASSQTAGRGRMGRSFYSPERTGVYISILVRPKVPFDKLFLLTPMAGVACVNALSALGCRGAGIKWVNDIYINDKKAAGILVEAAVSPDGKNPDYAVVGIGINLLSPGGGFPDDIKDVACGAFDLLGKSPDREEVAARFIYEFFKLYPRLSEGDFMTEYRRLSCLDGKRVTVAVGEDQYDGTVLCVDAEGHLVVDCDDGERRTFHSGEARAKAVR